MCKLYYHDKVSSERRFVNVTIPYDSYKEDLSYEARESLDEIGGGPEVKVQILCTKEEKGWEMSDWYLLPFKGYPFHNDAITRAVDMYVWDNEDSFVK